MQKNLLEGGINSHKTPITKECPRAVSHNSAYDCRMDTELAPTCSAMIAVLPSQQKNRVLLMMVQAECRKGQRSTGQDSHVISLYHMHVAQRQLHAAGRRCSMNVKGHY